MPFFDLESRNDLFYPKTKISIFWAWRSIFWLKKFFGPKNFFFTLKVRKNCKSFKAIFGPNRFKLGEIQKFLILTPFWTQKSQNFDFLATPEGDPTVLGPAEAEKRGLGPQKPPERLFWDPPKKFFFGPKITKFRLFLGPPRVTPLFWTRWTRKSALEPLIPPRRG